MPVVDEALKLSPLPKVIWMQLGARDDAAAEKAEAAGIKVVMNRCPKIEYGRLSSEISWMGVNSRTLSSKRAPMPTQGMRLSLNRMSVGGGETPASDRAAKNKTETYLTQLRNNRFRTRHKRSTAVPNAIGCQLALTADARHARSASPRIYRRRLHRAAQPQQDAQNDRSHPGIFNACRACRRAA